MPQANGAEKNDVSMEGLHVTKEWKRSNERAGIEQEGVRADSLLRQRAYHDQEAKILVHWNNFTAVQASDHKQSKRVLLSILAQCWKKNQKKWND